MMVCQCISGPRSRRPAEALGVGGGACAGLGSLQPGGLTGNGHVFTGSVSVCAQSSLTLWTLPSRLLCLWDFPGENTGVGCHFLLQGIFPGIESVSPASPALQADSLQLNNQESPTGPESIANHQRTHVQLRHPWLVRVAGWKGGMREAKLTWPAASTLLPLEPSGGSPVPWAHPPKAPSTFCCGNWEGAKGMAQFGSCGQLQLVVDHRGRAGPTLCWAGAAGRTSSTESGLMPSSLHVSFTQQMFIERVRDPALGAGSIAVSLTESERGERAYCCACYRRGTRS